MQTGGRSRLSAVLSVSGCRIRLPVGSWTHIVRRHPEIETLREEILETVRAPENVALGRTGELKAVRSLRSGRFLVVVYRESPNKEGFIITAYTTSEIDSVTQRGIIWRRS